MAGTEAGGMGYTKLFSSIITSSIWSEDDKTRIMWITMLATSDARGFVSGAVPGMAKVAGMSIEDAERSIDKLCSPDKWSRTKDHDGRRLLVVDGGWKIVNYQKFRDAGRSQERKEYLREKQRERRMRAAQNVNHCQPLSTIVNPSQPIAEAEAEAKTTTVVVVSSREDEPRGDDDNRKSGSVGDWVGPDTKSAYPTLADDVRSGCRKVIDLWNTFAKQPMKSAVEQLAVEPAYSRLVLGIPPDRLTHDQIAGSVENYRMACALPRSQAPKLGLARFLALEIVRKYLPGEFTLENYDSSRFARDGPGRNEPCDAEAGLKRLKEKGLL
jgi:hypothetical protein